MINECFESIVTIIFLNFTKLKLTVVNTFESKMSTENMYPIVKAAYCDHFGTKINYNINRMIIMGEGHYYKNQNVENQPK
jgi:hypothetical protein